MLRKDPRTLLPIMLLLLNSTSVYAYKYYAYSNVPSNNISVTVPNLRPGFEFSIAALALKPGANNLNYVIYNNELPAQSPTWLEKELRPNYHGAFELDAGYIFPEGKNVVLDWTHLNSTTSASTVAPNSSFFLGPDYEIGPPATTIRNATGSVEFKYDVVNLDFGQFVDFGRLVEMRFFGGVSTTFLREQINSTYSGTRPDTFPGPFSTMQEVTSNFTGIGPRFGIESNYNAGCGFGVLGEAAGSILVGSMYAKTSFLSSAQEIVTLYNQTSNSQWIRDQTTVQVVPALDAKLGISYQHEINRGALLTIKGGYQAAVYINAINQYLPGSLVSAAGTDTSIDTGGIFVATVSHTQSNYSVQGPFLEAVIAI